MGAWTREPKTAVTVAAAASPAPARTTRAPQAPYNATRGLTASAEQIRLDGKPKDNTSYQEWQREAWVGYEEVGEIHYGFNLLANLLSRVRIYPGMVGEINETPVDVTLAAKSDRLDQDAADAAKQLVDDLLSYDGSGLIRTFSLNMSVPGECYLVKMPLKDDKGKVTREVWTCKSTEEVRVTGTTVQITSMRGGAVDNTTLGKDSFIGRMWRPNPRYCADDQTEILTTDGWRSYDQLQVGDSVLTLNHNTGVSEWQPVEAVNLFNVANEPMQAMRSYTHSSVTTQEHRWPTMGLHSGRRSWKLSSTLSTSDVLTAAAPCAELPTEQKWSDAFVALVGWWWTEGHDGINTTISQSHRVNPHHCDTIRMNLTEVFGPPVSSKAQMRAGVALTTPLCIFDACDRQNWAEGLCKAHDMQRRRGVALKPVRRRSVAPARQQPQWREVDTGYNGMTSFVLNRAAAEQLRAVAPLRQVDLGFIRQLTRSQLELFIRTSIDADGHEEQRGRAVGGVTCGPYTSAAITQAKPEMLEPFVLACILAGYAPRVSNTSSGQTRVVIGTTARVHVGSMNPETVLYTGTVWCPTTANQTWLARRDGTVYFTGNSKEPDSSMVGVRTPVNALLMIERLIRGAIRSRLNAGMLFVPDTITGSLSSTATSEPVIEEETSSIEELQAASTEDPGGKFLAELIESMSAPIADETSAASVVPMLVTGPSDDGEKIKHITFERASDEWIARRAEWYLERVLNGIDIPKEIVTGLQAVKYSNAVVIDENLYKSNIEPLALALADALTDVYFRPYLIGMGIPADTVAKLVIWYDPSEIVTRPNSADDATQGVDRGLLSAAAWRREHGFAETDAPGPDDLAVQSFTKLTVLPDVVVEALVMKILGDALPGLQELLDQARELAEQKNNPSGQQPQQPQEQTGPGKVLPMARNTSVQQPAADPQQTAVKQVGR